MNEKPKRRRSPGRAAPPLSADPIDLAMAAEAGDPAPDSPARTLLTKQSQLIDADLAHRRWQIISEQAGFALKALTVAVGLVLAVSAGLMVWQATRYQGLVVEAFSVPPDLEARGLTGQAVAGQLLDRLVRMQGQTESIRAAGSYAIDWGDSIQVEIPQTGVSIGELQRYLRQWLGKETRISGVVYRTPEGLLAVTARSGGAAGETFTGPEADLDLLMQRTAENVYERTQPYRYAVYLGTTGRSEEADRIYRTFDGQRSEEAAWAYRGWGISRLVAGDAEGAIALYRRALEINPDMGVTWWTLINAYGSLGHAESQLEAARQAYRLLERDHDQHLSDEGREVLMRTAREAEMILLGDFAELARLRRDEPFSASFGYSAKSRLLDEAVAWTSAHDTRQAGRLLAQITLAEDVDWSQPFEGVGLRVAWAEWSLARDQPERAVRLARSAMDANDGPTAALAARTLAPLLARALAAAGRPEEAAAVIGDTAPDCYDCVTARGEVAVALGDAAQADRWFAEAIGLGPSIPAAYALWGEALAARGESDRALELLRQAQRLGPRWADPLKLEADVLAAGGDHRGAVRRYAEAAELAPEWAALHLAWGRSLAAQGRTEAARERFRQASTLHLTAADRRTVQALLAG